MNILYYGQCTVSQSTFLRRFVQGPFVISRAALKGKASGRLDYLAKPKKDFYCESNDFLSASEDSFVKNKAGPNLPRLILLSQPRRLVDKYVAKKLLSILL